MENEDTLSAKLIKDVDGYLALESGDMRITCDFTKSIRRIKGGNLGRELLVRAAKIKDAKEDVPLAIDMTAGLGDDSFLLAAAGFRVLMFEKDPTIAALLRDGLSRAMSDVVPCETKQSSKTIISDRDRKLLLDAVSRMTLIEGDSIEALNNPSGIVAGLTERPDIILLDPMFPEKQKNSLTKKKLQLIQLLERPCEDEEALLGAAINAGPRKVIIKRPIKGPYLAGCKPTYSLEGKTVRIDCIVP